MTIKKSLNEYLNEIRACEDLYKLENELQIEDNWPVLLYGDSKELFSKITKAFKDSPKPEGIRNKWKYAGKNRGVLGEMQQLFDYDLGTVVAQVKKCAHGMYLSEKDKINGSDHSVLVMFHPYNAKKMENVSETRAMALAIVDFVEYIVRENLTARLPGKLDLNYVPE